MTSRAALPRRIQIDAWAGKRASGRIAEGGLAWGAAPLGGPHEPLDLEAPADPTQWAHEDVGYGILVSDDDAGEWSKAKVTGADLAPSLRRLLAARKNAVVLRWRPAHGATRVRRYYPDGRASDLRIGLTAFGTGIERLPRYVLIAAPPAVIPWEVQYAFALRHAVGRLPFTGDDFARYVDAMLDGPDGWDAAPPVSGTTAIWAVDHGARDITRLMKTALAEPLVAELTDPRMKVQSLKDADATGDLLLKALRARPTLVVTSSHGATPLDQAEMTRTLGLPVDRDKKTLPIDDLVAEMPSGAVWFSQACCSAGADGQSSYSGLLEEGTMARSVVDAVALQGSIVAPGPAQLLAREKPVRGVLAHVEPTFDVTLRDPATKQRFTHDIVAGLTDHLHAGRPLGLILADYYAGIGPILRDWADQAATYDDPATADPDAAARGMVRLRLTAWDRQALVLLGDPTVHIPAII